jgi:exonuclease SbcD
MRFGHLADVHAGHRQYGVKAREEDMTNTLYLTLSEQVSAGAEAILLPGDLFDDRDLRPDVLASVEGALEKATSDVPVIVTRGNHDENLTPRDFTWLEYLDQKGHLTLLEAKLNAEVPVEMFPAAPDADNPVVSVAESESDHPGYIDLPTEGDKGPVRVFGLQYRGGYIDTALEEAGEAIATINEQAPTPSMTVLMAHFGMSDEVPDLGGRVSDAALNPVRDEVDYLALGHIHKQYARDWAFNPGSPEVHSTGEAQWDDAHGHYLVDVGSGPDGMVTNPTSTTAAGVPFRATHHLSKRRPFHRIDIDISDVGTFDGLASLFEAQIRDEIDAIEAACEPERFRMRSGNRRAPVLDVRLQGTLQFERRDLDTDHLTEIVHENVDVLYVQLTDHTETVAIQELMDGVDEEAVFDGDGTLNIEAVEGQVFETIVNESPYSDETDSVVSLLRDVRREMSAEDTDNAIETVSTLVSETRREAFASGVDDDLDIDVDVDIPPSPVEQAEQDDAESSDTDGTESDSTGDTADGANDDSAEPVPEPDGGTSSAPDGPDGGPGERSPSDDEGETAPVDGGGDSAETEANDDTTLEDV